MNRYARKLRLPVLLGSLAFASLGIAQERPTEMEYRVLEDNKSWQLVEYSQSLQFSETLPDKHAQFHVLKGREGIMESNLPDMIKQDLLEDLDRHNEEDLEIQKGFEEQYENIYLQQSEGITLIHTGIAEAIANNDVDTLAKYARLYNHSLSKNLETSEYPLDQDVTNNTHAEAFFFFCKSTRNYSRSFSIDIPDINLNEDFKISNSLNGRLEIGFQHSATQDPEVDITIDYKVKRWCGIPYSIKLRQVRFNLQLQADDQNYGLHGEVGIALQEISTRLFDLRLGRGVVFLGPIPVYYGADLPIDVGLWGNADVSADISVALHGSGYYILQGQCTEHGCGFSDNAGFDFDDVITPEFVGGVEANVRLYPFLRATAIGWLYHENILSLHLGAQAEVPLWGWGYYGNSCGDANNDNINETVSALTLDVQARVRVLGKLRAFWNDHHFGFNGNTVWDTHLAFIDLLGNSSALTPIIEPSPDTGIYAGYSKQFNTRMRPCYPYDAPVSYLVEWGDGGSSSFTGGIPVGSTPAYHTWSNGGAYTLRATALEDSDGRDLNAATSYQIQVNNGAPAPRAPRSISFMRLEFGGALPIVDRPQGTETIQIFTQQTLGGLMVLEGEMYVANSLYNPVTLLLPLEYNQWVRAKACNASGCSPYSTGFYLNEYP